MSNIPKGWKLVPVEPTKEMIDANLNAPLNPRREWLAMPNASPEAPTPANTRPVVLPARMEHALQCHPMIHESFRGGWNSCLDAMNKLGPLYTHSDKGDIERMEDELALLSLEAGQKMEDLERERDTLRAQLAELSKLADGYAGQARGPHPGWVYAGSVAKSIRVSISTGAKSAESR
ncbi:hypothetical protein HX866_07380 [Pseudomonas gingeri]|uniref:hypothetical protein n=1 Tax=Pseudomonas gingeri TaxID=117681 RepID=UPI0015A314EE|nr:hypothetical protein [Pseudomonas gingeri]NWA24710.1 hypothetical protein [Pseudomonas gingeri]